MKIKKIEFENFRNFMEHGEINCSTDGKVTVIYGKNGDGKTTLHQLFQWIIYGKVHFNKTATPNLYNLKFENDCDFGDVFEVLGRIDFEHNGEDYCVSRVAKYRKGINDSEKLSEDFSLIKKDDDNNWAPIDNPSEVMEKLLPSGLTDYFFFDGESMIADLRVKGKDSANKLRKALYSMFNLDVVEAAISHIGRTDLKTTALGKLYLSKGNVSSGSEISACKTNIENAQNRIMKLEQSITELEAQKAESEDLVKDISEKIGSSKSKADYEAKRKEQKSLQKTFLNNAVKAKADFGEAIIEMFPKLFISKAVETAKDKMQFEISKNQLPDGINKKLILHLLSHNTTECICGTVLSETEKQHIASWLDLLPPKSYTSLYNEFSRTAQNWGKNYDLERIESYIISVLDNEEQAQKCDLNISAIDEEEKKSSDIEDLVVARKKAEQLIIGLQEKITAASIEKQKYELYLKREQKKFDQLTASTKQGVMVSKKIDILTETVQYFVDKLSEASVTYSKELEENIQSLIDEMLTSERHVSVSKDFAVTVTDSFGDEAKSEGQFAVISFAYIGGILKMLQSKEDLSEKEYPLVLDGPFSKLDSDQRQNVVDTIPTFAPQVILFSKDDLQNVLKPEQIGRIWTIKSNREKNIARVEEGFLWN